MTSGSCWHPDLLRRFIATPYVFSKGDGRSRICVESNDLEIALSVRHFGMVYLQRSPSGSLLCKLIRDTAAPVDGSRILIVSDGKFRILQRGRGTILIHDIERSELLGFVSLNVKAQELVSSLIPALLSV